MNKQQLIVIFGGLAALAGLYFLGPTVAPQKPVSVQADSSGAQNQPINIDTYEQQAIGSLTREQQQYITGLKAQVKRGDVKDQAIHVNHQLATFWKDSVGNPLLYFNYSAKAADLDNTEKSLTFAAHSILGYLPFAESHAEQSWLANEGKSLFDKALAINPTNDSSIVGAGGCIMYGAGAAGAGPMEGILKVREVAEKDSTNLFAQYMLGVGGVISGQYDKAAARFEKVAAGQPDNLEVLFKLAETYELMGDKAKAIQWYEVINSRVSAPDMKAAISQRINELKK